MRKYTDNLEAYDSFLRGVESLWRGTKEANAEARQMFEKAVALDPQYAEAYTGLSGTYWVEWASRWSVDPQTLERALALAQQAVALDDSLPGAHSRLGMVYAVKQQYEQAIAEGERAIALDPNHADSYAWQAEALRFAGRPEEALRMVEQAMRLNARSELGQAAEARAEAVEVLRFNPHFSLEIHKQRMPIKDPVVLERHLAALRKAGLK